MSYKRYVSRVESRRALLEAELVKANLLRAEAHLPLRHIDKVVADRQPLLTKEEFQQEGRDSQAFSRFRREHLAKLDKPTDQPELQDEMVWQTKRALAYRRAFVQHRIQQAWLDQAKGHVSSTNP